MVNSLILTVTRACNLRCSYCPTAKDGWPSLSEADAIAAVDLFAERYGGGHIKLFGGEPLLEPDVVRAVMDHAVGIEAIERVYLSTNGLGLDQDWLDYLRQYPKGVLTLSMDGKPEDHRRLRRALPGIDDTYEHIMQLREELLKTPRVVITQTIAPATAARCAENYAHLAGLGFWRFNFLPGYYLPWSDKQVAELREGFDTIATDVETRWQNGEKLYVRNLFTRAPTPFFNTGLVVDADRSIHPSNVGLSGSLEELLGQTQVGTLDDPPSPEALAQRASEINAMLEEKLPDNIWQATQRVDAELTRFCQRLYPAYVERRRKESAA